MAQKRINNSIEYPCYISNQPRGEDLYEGRSQERLVNALVEHISDSDKSSDLAFPRLIGLEGKWGSGKSNVIKLLEKKLKNKYTFFTFDAWGNQEDLQRRSILEMLTKYLIENHKLEGKTKVKIMSTDKDGIIMEKECTWEEKLESLLSRKSYTKNITVPSVNKSTKFFVLSLLTIGFVLSFLAVNQTNDWWLNLIIAIFPFLFFSIGMFVTRSSWSKMFAMYNTDSRSDTTSFVISEQEPSVREFKEWMREISNGIPKTDRIVLVFDNADRLPKEKVHQFWSLIQTFFADDGYNNVWCIVPYDENHLADIFTKGDEKDNSLELLRGYLHKTFPVVFRVPDPIISDYKCIFEKLYKDAFGPDISDEILDIISRCYRCVCLEPNVREIITFINRSVKYAKQWKGLIDPISISIYTLKSDAIIRNPQLPDSTKEEKVMKTVTTEEYILSNYYYRDFSHILFDKIDSTKIKRDIAAIVYGVEPDVAYQLMVKRHIRNCISGKSKGDLATYSGTPHFMLLLWEEINAMDPSDYRIAVPLIAEVDSTSMSHEGISRLNDIWSLFAARYSTSLRQVKEYSDYEKTIMSHLKEEERGLFAKSFCQCLIDNQEVDGAEIYNQLSSLFNDENAKKLDTLLFCPKTSLAPKRFADYVNRAGKDYKRFPFKTDAEVLNQFLIESIEKEYQYLPTLRVLKEDESYTVSNVSNYAVEELNKNDVKLNAAYNYIRIQRVFFSKLKSTLNQKYIHSLWQEAQKETGSLAYLEVYAMYAVDTFDQLESDDDHINVLLERILFYTTTTNILENYLRDKTVRFRKKLVSKIIKTNTHDSKPDYPQFIEHWKDYVDSTITRNDLIKFADNWGFKEIPDKSKTKPFFSLLADDNWIDALLIENTPLSQKLLTKCVDEMITQDVDQFVQPNTASHTNSLWDKALMILLPTEYLSPDNYGRLNDVAAYLIDYIARVRAITDNTWETLISKVKSSFISTQLNEIRIKILNNQNGYTMTPQKFKQLHYWLERAEINNKNNWTDSANLILAKVVKDIDCQKIIAANGTYYNPIIVNTTETASALHNYLKEVMRAQKDSDFAKYLNSIVSYE